MKPQKRSFRNGKVLLGVMVDPELREKTHLAVRRLSQYGNLTEFIVTKSHEVIEQAGLPLDDVRLLDAHRVMVGDVDGSNDCWHVRKACAAWVAAKSIPNQEKDW